ncbi:hypothetical protein BY458DRAFT_508428 [Sporodiniella umbellata]|nr:hypothetical protein BY458DRAFT_508428 [Sporodiniella umbellata]
MSKNTISSLTTAERRNAVAEVVRDMILDFEKEEEAGRKSIAKVRTQGIQSIVQSAGQLSIQPNTKFSAKPNTQSGVHPNFQTNSKPHTHPNTQTNIQTFFQPKPQTKAHNVVPPKPSPIQPSKQSVPQAKPANTYATEQYYPQAQRLNTQPKKANTSTYTPLQPSQKRRLSEPGELPDNKMARPESSDSVVQEEQQTNNALFRPFRSITSTLGLGSAQTGESLMPDTAPLCIFESSGGQCNDSNCKASHWRDFIK